MDGIQLIQDAHGKLSEIRIDAKMQPDIAEDIYHFINALIRAKDTEKKHNPLFAKADGPMSLTAFNQLIREAKASGEITEEAFFQSNPQWRKKEKLSLLS